MNTKFNNLLTPTAAAASLIMLGSCGDDDEAEVDKSDLLIGDWELVSVDGEKAGEDYDDYSYSLVFKFEADGDFEWCYNYENKVTPAESYEDCLDGDWKWIAKGEELTFGFTYSYEEDGESISYEVAVDLEITYLSETKLEGIWDVAGEDEDYEVVFKKL
tara:strand:+ start:154 stop:633 length:480 start_codon:yes stop_codon:yes gene_type:complete